MTAGTRRTLATGFLVFHLAAITVANLPRTTALGSFAHRPFEIYLTLANLWQGWDMFTTIPHYAKLGGVVLARNEDGSERRYGPMLPGLAPYADEPRLHSLFLRLAFSSDHFGNFGTAYGFALCRAIGAATGKVPPTVGFELTTEELRPISEVRRDGRIGNPKPLLFDQRPCPK